MAGPVKTIATNADGRTDLRLLAGAEFGAGRYECGFTSSRISGRPALCCRSRLSSTLECRRLSAPRRRAATSSRSAGQTRREIGLFRRQ
jgi:hypothetical protein